MLAPFTGHFLASNLLTSNEARRIAAQRCVAIRFAVKNFPAIKTPGAWMQVGDERFDSVEICRLYESSGYLLRRNVSTKTIELGQRNDDQR
jgi:hypothetical protein